LSCKWQVEIDPFCRQVLAKHWPGVPKFGDIREFATGSDIDELRVDVLCGGFPCQDISTLNPRAVGISGERSGLWKDYLRIIRVLRPRYVVIENVPALSFRGLDRVLIDLAESGLDAEWNTLSAAMFGAPHLRQRIFIVAHADGIGCEENEVFAASPFEAPCSQQRSWVWQRTGVLESSPAMPGRIRLRPHRELCRMVNELPDRLDRYRGLGNAVVPACAEWIGRRLIDIANA
jgi:DNA (cytosine-5)-methyltransferase 1